MRQVGESKVIAGWHQGLLGMKKGTKRFLVIGAGMTALVEAARSIGLQ
jgi:FKBP-type peptidyl-prolyl cis-trans isomerase